MKVLLNSFQWSHTRLDSVWIDESDSHGAIVHSDVLPVAFQTETRCPKLVEDPRESRVFPETRRRQQTIKRLGTVPRLRVPRVRGC